MQLEKISSIIYQSLRTWWLGINPINFLVRLGLGVFFTIQSLQHPFEPALLIFGLVLMVTAFMKTRCCNL